MRQCGIAEEFARRSTCRGVNSVVVVAAAVDIVAAVFLENHYDQ